MCGTQSTPGGGAPSQTQPILANIASQGNQIKRALSKSRQAQAAGSSKAAKVFDAANASGGQSQQQQSTAVLLDIDKLVKTSAAAAFLGNAPSGKAVQKPRAPHQVAMSRNTVQIAESHSGKTSQAVAAHPLVGKKTVAAAGTGTATQASQGSATVVTTNMTPTDSVASNQLQKMLRQQASSQNQQRH